MSRLLVGPFNRAEGDLEVALEIENGTVREARVNAPLYRGFERMLLGKSPLDALVIAPRICGICSVAQSTAAALALAGCMGLEPTPNGRRVRNVVLAAESLLDHLTHFYLFFMPDFARPEYAGATWHDDVAGRFRAMTGSARDEFLASRAAFLHLMGLLAGKWPHTLAIQPGGTTRSVTAAERLRLLGIVREFRRRLEGFLFGDDVEAVATLDGAAALERWHDEGAGRGDLRRFLDLAAAGSLDGVGRSRLPLLSYGSYPDGEGLTFARGVWRDGAAAPLDVAAIAEDVSHSWSGTGEARVPADGRTAPDADKGDAYSWCKAPRLGGEPAETGAFARQVIAGHPLAVDLAGQGGSNVRSRVVGRLLEAARLLQLIETWVGEIRPNEPFNASGTLPDEGEGAGLVEAARGALGHWLSVRDGRIANYQIVAPTTWNFSPRDAAGVPGPLEQALAGTPSGDEDPSAGVFHVVRSFDPCMVCTVH
ncbi:MAG: nickel-dependent hydrogenase large subunit [Gammaproteobacteria bacterium]|nr:nickel-dependent hydrogenase large subunit [Gammaproteobacteria bacterium]